MGEYFLFLKKETVGLFKEEGKKRGGLYIEITVFD